MEGTVERQPFKTVQYQAWKLAPTSNSLQNHRKWYSATSRRGLTWGSYFAWYYGLNANVSFQAVKNLSAYLTHLRIDLFCKFFGDSWVYLRINSYPQRISKIVGNEKFGRFDVVLKLEFELKIGRRTPNSCPSTWGAL